MVRKAPFESILDRKEKYIEHTTDTDWLNVNMIRWEFKLPKIDLSIGFNLSFNFLLDFYLALDLHFPYDEFDFEMPDFVFDFQRIEKAKYGVSRYNYSYYDPPNVSPKDLARFLWNIRYQTTEKSVPTYKRCNHALKKYIETHKEILKSKDISNHYIESLIEKLLIAESKTLNSSYVGFSVVGVAKVVKKTKRRNNIMGLTKIRWTDDYKTERDIPTKYPYETLVNYSRVGYARVIPSEKKYKDKVLRPLSKNLHERVKEFKKRSSKTPITKGLDVEIRPEIEKITKQIPPPKHTLYQRVFFLKKRYDFKWEGGKHQARLQNIIEHVKPILDKHGIHGNFRLGYIAFAKEYVYMHYKPHRKHKQWRKILNEDDLILKYKRMGCDEQVLREIVDSIKLFKTVADIEAKQK